MTHLTLEQLVQLREPGLEPGVASLRAHLTECPHCQIEATKLDQRANRIRALPSLRPARDHWPALEQRLRAERRSQLVRRVIWAGMAAAAGIALVSLLVQTVRRLAPSETWPLDSLTPWLEPSIRNTRGTVTGRTRVHGALAFG